LFRQASTSFCSAWAGRPRSATRTPTSKGRTGSAMALADQQRKTRGELVTERVREGKTLAGLQVERAEIEGERKTVEANLGPVKCLATLLGAGGPGCAPYVILVVRCWPEPATRSFKTSHL
jgi:hypothetical protein